MSKVKLVPGITLLFVLLHVSSQAQLIPSSRSVDWTHVGIPGGIPDASWPIYTTINPSGGADDSVAIQTAINNAPAGSVVVLGAGTFTLHRSSTVCYGKTDDYGSGVYEAGLCLTDKSVVLRGQGPNKTILNYGDGANIISMGKTYLSSSQVSMISVSSGSTKGSQSLTLASTTGISVGSYLVVTQTNPNDSDGNLLANPNGYTGLCDFCGHDMSNNLMTQIVKVTAISGKTITTEFPLYFDFTTSPSVYLLFNMIEGVGLENLRVIGTAASGTSLTFKNVNMESCSHCWVHNVESDMAVDKSHMYLSDTYGCEVSNSYFNDGFNHNSGATYSILVEFRNSQDLIQNNIVHKGRHATPQSGSSGNVYGYNYEVDDYMGEYPASLPETQAHAAHPFMTLWEGNTMPNMEWDNAHGSSSHNTLFRNYIDLTGTNPSTGTKQNSGVYAMNIAYDANYANVFGNVIGTPSGSCTLTSYQDKANGTSNDANEPPAVFTLGYYDDGGTTSPNAALSAKVESTLLRGGNWDCKTGAVIWSSNAPAGTLASSYVAQQTVPNSLYLSSKPAWFGSSPWPLIGPDVTGGISNVGGHANKSPAQLCYESGPATGAAFNPSTCYTSSAQPPAAPTNPTAVAR